MDRDPVDFFYYRNTLGQGLFQLRSFQSWYSLHFLAQNLPVPSVVLENPSMRRFQREVSTGSYQVVAIGFTVITMARILPMVTWLKQTYPEIEVILGGYGTAAFKDPDATAGELRAKADGICYGEGVAFMREYLGRRWGIRRPAPGANGGTFRQDFLEMRHCFFHTPFPLFKQIVLLGALGCTYGCPFCSTSSQFGRRRLVIASGTELFHQLLLQARAHPGVTSAIIYDEDFLMDRRRVLEFMHLMEGCTELQERPMLVTVFASVRSVRMYSIAELLRCGIGTIYIGVESFQAEVLTHESLEKRGGDVEELFEELHRHGINTLGSLILGWDGQTPAQMTSESERFALLNPTFYQVVPLHPVPGTPLWKRLKSENRMLRGYSYGDDRIDRFTFELRGATEREALAAVAETYHRLVSEGGPWPFRLAETLLKGCQTLGQACDEASRRRARAYRKILGTVLPLALVSRIFFHGQGYVRRWRHMVQTGVREFPVRTGASALAAVIALPVLSLLYLGASLVFWLRPSGDQPPCIRRAYAGDASG